MKKTIIILCIALILSGCNSMEYKRNINNVEIQFSTDIQNSMEEIKNAYYFTCPQEWISYEEKFDMDYIFSQDIELNVLDANYSIKDYEELISYFEAYINNLFVFDSIREEEKCYVESCEFIYLRRLYNGEYYLLPVLEVTIRDYGCLYIEVNSGCIIW